MVLKGVMDKKPKKTDVEKYAILSQLWNSFFWDWELRFFNFFLDNMVQKYQNEIAPIFYYEISTKTNEKDLKIPNLQPPDWKHPYWMSLYFRREKFNDFVFHMIYLWRKKGPHILDFMYCASRWVPILRVAGLWLGVVLIIGNRQTQKLFLQSKFSSFFIY